MFFGLVFLKKFPFIKSHYILSKEVERNYLCGNYSYALQFQIIICKNRPNSLKNLYLLAIYAINKGDIYKAIETAEKIFKTNKSNDDANKILKLVEKSHNLKKFFRNVREDRLDKASFKKDMIYCMRILNKSIIQGFDSIKNDDFPDNLNIDILGSAFLRKREYKLALETYKLYKKSDITSKRKLNIALCLQNIEK